MNLPKERPSGVWKFWGVGNLIKGGGESLKASQE